jgi:trimethylamine--corrinoid protein Co-methyltransferase
VVNEIAPGGHYLSHDHTLKFFRSETYFPTEIIDRLTAKEWQKKGSKDAKTRGKEKVKEILAKHEPVLPDKDQVKELRSALETAVKKRGLAGIPDVKGLD